MAQSNSHTYSCLGIGIYYVIFFLRFFLLFFAAIGNTNESGNKKENMHWLLDPFNVLKQFAQAAVTTLLRRKKYDDFIIH